MDGAEERGPSLVVEDDDNGGGGELGHLVLLLHTPGKRT